MAPPPLSLSQYLAPHEPVLGPRPAAPLRPPAPPLAGRLPLLTEALGTESFDPDGVAAAAMDDAGAAPPCKRQHLAAAGADVQEEVVIAATTLRRTRSGRAFPPPISVIGKGGRPWLSLRAHREAGRLVLREMRLPSQELLKEDGRFKLLIHPEAGGRGGVGAGPRAAAAARAHE